MDTLNLVVRRLGPAELADYDAHLKRLDRRSRRSRFAATVDDLSIDSHCLQLATQDVILLGGFVDGVMCGGAEIVLCGNRTAEAAFTVEPQWQGRGIGRALFTLALAAAREAGLRELQIEVLGGSPAMIRLVKASGGRLIGLGQSLSYRVELGAGKVRAA